MIFDTSFSMGYTTAGKTRLELAVEHGVQLLKDFPDGSRIAVLDTADQGGDWLSPVGAAKELARERIAGLELRPISFPLTSQLATAYDLLARQEFDSENAEETVPKFLYVFSDRTEACWDARLVEGLKRLRDRVGPPGVHSVFIDVGVDSPAALAIAELRLEQQAISPHENIVIEATVAATGDTYDTQVACLVDDKPLTPRLIHLGPGQSEVIRFERDKWSPGFHQVVVQLGTKDAALPFNGIRYPTFLVRGSRKVLTITDRRQSESQDPIWALALRAGRAFDSEVKL